MSEERTPQDVLDMVQKMIKNGTCLGIMVQVLNSDENGVTLDSSENLNTIEKIGMLHIHIEDCLSSTRNPMIPASLSGYMEDTN